MLHIHIADLWNFFGSSFFAVMILGYLIIVQFIKKYYRIDFSEGI